MAARRLGAVAIAAAVCAVSLTTATWACGDKLVALGGGVGFDRVMVSRNPSHIIMMLEPSTGLTAANDRFNLESSLKLAGHEVFIAKSADELREQRVAAAPDLILVDASRAKELQFQFVSSGSGPVIMPVAYSADGNGVAAADREDGCVTVADGRKGAQVLKAVEHALKLRSRGLPLPCETSADSQKA